MNTADPLHTVIREARLKLERAGIEQAEASLDVDVLARHALGGWDRGRLLVNLRETAPEGFARRFDPLIERRERREPTAYITGHREFWGIEFEVAPGVLVPRPETEFIVEEALARLAPNGQSRIPNPPSLAVGHRVRIADVGTGSGCVAIALARSLPEARVTATDLSDAALAVAARNITRHGVQSRVALVRCDLLAATTGPFDVIVSNPPYVPSGDLASLQPEILDYEPRLALEAGPDGLDVIRQLVPAAAGRLVPGGWLIFEFGDGQASGVRAIIAAEPRLAVVAWRDDLAGISRTAVLRRR